MLSGEQLETLAGLAREYDEVRSREQAFGILKKAAGEQIRALFLGSGQDSADVAGFRVSLDTVVRETAPLELLKARIPASQLEGILQVKTTLQVSVRELKKVKAAR